MSSPSDLTARARIRDAAITLFADRGVSATTVRDIAQEAGVSSGLLRHHFGSKEGLRDACDEFALTALTAMGMSFTETGVVGQAGPRVQRLQRYLIRSTLDGSPGGRAMFGRMLDYGEQWLSTTDLKVTDPRAFVAVISVMKMSMFVMRDLLEDTLGEDLTTQHGWTRLLHTSLEIFSQPLVTPEQVDQARKVLLEMEEPEP